MPHTLDLIPEQFIRVHLLDHLICDMYSVLNSFAVHTQRRINGANIKSVEHCDNYVYHLLQVWQNRNLVHTLHLRIMYYSNNKQQLTPRAFFLINVYVFPKTQELGFWQFKKKVVKMCILTFLFTKSCRRTY